MEGSWSERWLGPDRPFLTAVSASTFRHPLAESACLSLSLTHTVSPFAVIHSACDIQTVAPEKARSLETGEERDVCVESPCLKGSVSTAERRRNGQWASNWPRAVTGRTAVPLVATLDMASPVGRRTWWHVGLAWRPRDSLKGHGGKSPRLVTAESNPGSLDSLRGCGRDTGLRGTPAAEPPPGP